MEKIKSEELASDNLSLLDDLYFSSILNNNVELATFILKIILNKDDLIVNKITTQKQLTNIKGHSLILDAYAIDSKKRKYNIEIQNTKTKDLIFRARYHLSLLDSNNLKKNKDFSSLVETYVIFFCNFDLYHKNKPIYLIDRYVDGKYLFNDGEHIIFVNCTYKDKSTKIGKLIHDIKSKVGEDKCYNIFRINEEKGDIKMGEHCQRIYNKGIEEGIQKGIQQYSNNLITNMFKNGLDVDLISKISGKGKDELLEFKKKNNI